MSSVNRVVVVQHDGKLTLEGLPFHAGDTVEVIVLPLVQPVDQQVKLQGSVVRYEDPFEPAVDRSCSTS